MDSISTSRARPVLDRRMLRSEAVALVLGVVLGAAGCARLIWAARRDSQDFHVYWKAVQSWLAGVSPYLYSPQDLGFVFKYPPWLLPVFLPFGIAPWEISLVLWAFLELACMAYAIRWLIGQGVRPRISLGVAALFWWIWLAHFFAGQFTLVVLFIALACGPVNRSGRAEPRAGALLVTFSAKVFTLFPLVGFTKRYFRLRPILWAAALALGLQALVVGGYLASGKASGIIETNRMLLQGWKQAAASGGAELGADVIRGTGNHGFTAAILRWLEVDPLAFQWDVLTAGILGVILGGLWYRFSKQLGEAERWAGWLALGVVIHPLAWHHSFVLAFPLCAFAMERAFRSKRIVLALAFLGPVCIGLLVPQSIGKVWVKPLELVGVKSWGVCFSALALLLASRVEGSEK